jgi:drug/metabolite transporter (DMT)-like permease
VNTPRPPARTALGKGYAIALSSVLLWSWTGILIAWLLRHHPLAPMTLAFWRDLFVALALLLGLRVLRPAALSPPPGARRLLLVHGLSLLFMNFTWTWSVAWNGAAVSTVLVYASPGITGLLARWRYQERLGPLRLLAFAASLSGCVLVARAHQASQWHLNGWGIAAGLASALSFALYSLLGKATARRAVDPWTATLWSFAVAAVLLLPVALLSAPPSGPQASLLSLGAAWDGWAVLLLLAVVPTIGGYGLYTASLAHLPAGTANLIATLEPVLTTAWATLLLDERLLPVQLVGGALIVGSVVVLRLEESAPAPPG